MTGPATSADPVVLPGNVAPVPAYLLLDAPPVAHRGYAPQPQDRFQGVPRREPNVLDVLAISESDRAMGTYEGSSRPSLGMW